MKYVGQIFVDCPYIMGGIRLREIVKEALKQPLAKEWGADTARVHQVISASPHSHLVVVDLYKKEE